MHWTLQLSFTFFVAKTPEIELNTSNPILLLHFLLFSLPPILAEKKESHTHTLTTTTHTLYILISIRISQLICLFFLLFASNFRLEVTRDCYSWTRAQSLNHWIFVNWIFIKTFHRISRCLFLNIKVRAKCHIIYERNCTAKCNTEKPTTENFTCNNGTIRVFSPITKHIFVFFCYLFFLNGACCDAVQCAAQTDSFID